MKFRLCLLLLGLCLLIAGCSLIEQQPSRGGVYVPPTGVPQTPLVLPLPTATQTVAPAQMVAQPSPTPACTNDLRFLQDLTLPDGTVVAPGASLDKRWLVENSGTCNWTADYRLRLIAGSGFGAPREQALYPARAGVQAILRMQLVAPAQAGVHTSAWQAVDPQGNLFGKMVYIQIVVR